MAKSSKWLNNVARKDRVDKVARRALGERLSSVARFLCVAEGQPIDNLEFVHQLRVSTRRATAALKLFSKLVPNRERNWFERTLRELRQSAGVARDLDVLSLQLTEQAPAQDSLLRMIREQRIAVQPVLLKACRRLKNKYAKRVEQLNKSIAQDQDKQRFGPWAERRLQKPLRRMFESSARDEDDLPALHAFRVRVKKLRYSMELLAPAFPDSFRSRLYPQVVELQEWLGKIHDQDVAIERYQDWLERVDSAAQVELQCLIDRTRDDLRRSVHGFHDWWTTKREEKMHAAFDQLVPGDSTRV